jgi:hypothetical protein
MALAIACGAQAVRLKVFGGPPAQKALSTGWLIIGIVDVLSIPILSSEPSSSGFRFVEPTVMYNLHLVRRMAQWHNHLDTLTLSARERCLKILDSSPK